MAYKHTRGGRNPMHEQRRVTIGGQAKATKLSPEHEEADKQIRALFQKTADDLLVIVDGIEKRDEGRVTAALDKIKSARRVACDSITLPLVPNTGK